MKHKAMKVINKVPYGLIENEYFITNEGNGDVLLGKFVLVQNYNTNTFEYKIEKVNYSNTIDTSNLRCFDNKELMNYNRIERRW